jgi:hypothetical protein
VLARTNAWDSPPELMTPKRCRETLCLHPSLQILEIPLQGGGKFVSARRSREELSSLRLTCRSTAQTIDQSIRAVFAEASGASATLGFSRKQQAAARRDYELAPDSYVLGVASILSLLDSQPQLLDRFERELAATLSPAPARPAASPRAMPRSRAGLPSAPYARRSWQ